MLKLGILLVLAFAVASFWYANRPLAQRTPVVDIEIAPGSSMRQVARQVELQGIAVQPLALVLIARLSGHANQIKAGNYRVEQGISSWGLIQLLTSGSTAHAQIALIEGWNFRRLRAALDALPDLRHDTLGLSDAEVMARLGRPNSHPEGMFFPDTYYFSRGSSDLDVLRRALAQMERMLEKEWAQRSPGLPLKTPYEALVLASVVEKETGKADDRDKIASVFVNRLRTGMPLQSDPTVIYGMGVDFDGNLRKRDLVTDTAYNSYTRGGLPPTPIAMPGLAALKATLHPATTTYLYFVARGDGSSHFSSSLDEHNRAVARYQKGRG